VCGQTFSANKGTAFYGLRTAKELIVIVVTLLAHGCPVQAIVAAFKLDERTVLSWQKRAREQCARVHEHLVEQPRDLGQVQAVVSCRLAVVSCATDHGLRTSAHRDGELITALVQKVKASALCRPLLFCVDGFPAYVGAIQRVFRVPVPSGKAGRPKLRPWDDICIGQVIKQRAQRRVVGITRCLVQGTEVQIKALLQRTQGGGQINVAYIERLNATFRARLTALVRRGRALARRALASRHVSGGHHLQLLHLSPPSASLSAWQPPPLGTTHARTPAIAAGITDHLWTVEDVLRFRTSMPPWTPPKCRGRPTLPKRSLRSGAHDHG
jgi:hypothetical protein